MSKYRFTKRALKKAIAAAVQGGGVTVSVSTFAVGEAANPRWTAEIHVVDTVQSTEVVYPVGDDNGKLKFFADHDAIVKFLAGVNEDGDGEYKIDYIWTGSLFASKVPANIYTDAESKVQKLLKANVGQLNKRSALHDLIESGGAMHGWDNGNAAQRARYAETVDQIAALDGDMVAIGEEINRLNAIIDNMP